MGVRLFQLAVSATLIFLVACQKKASKPKEIEGSGRTTEPTTAQPAVEPPMPSLGDVFTVATSGTEMLLVRPGTFMMGSPEDESGRESIEAQHNVTITQGFWLGKYEVTRLEWEKVMSPVQPPQADTDSDEPTPDPYADVERPKFPKVNVNWIEAMDFCDKLALAEKEAGNLPEGYIYSLPTESQWEYACRAGTTTSTAFGNELGPGDAAIDPQRPYGAAAKARIPKRLHKVGEYEPNAWGFYDMHGNAVEWCRDFFFARYPTGLVLDPIHLHNTGLKVKRGGSFFLDGTVARSAKRGSDSPNRQSDELGFRLSLVSE